MSARAGFLFGAGAAALAALPAAVREEPAVLVWLALTGASAAVLGPLLAALRELRPLGLGPIAVLLGLGLASWPLALLLAALKSNTHHRPLGAVTFAFGAAIVVIAASALALRLLTWFQPRPTNRMRHWGRVALTLCATLGPLLLLLRLGGSPQTRVPLFDASLALGLSAVTMLVPWSERALRWAARVGPVAWMLIVAAGVFAARQSSELALEASPSLLAPFVWLLR